MLTTKQIDRFIEITEDHVGLDADDVIATRDTVQEFVAAQGQPEVEAHGNDSLYVWAGATTHSHSLYVTDFGDVRAVYAD